MARQPTQEGLDLSPCWATYRAEGPRHGDVVAIRPVELTYHLPLRRRTVEWLDGKEWREGMANEYWLMSKPYVEGEPY
jgi:hypothetical protein